jgi:hypothetical protein
MREMKKGARLFHLKKPIYVLTSHVDFDGKPHLQAISLRIIRKKRFQGQNRFIEEPEVISIHLYNVGSRT